jgi:CheY-like chemotaxis protein
MNVQLDTSVYSDLIVDIPDITLTFKVGLEEYHYYHDDKRRFEVYTYKPRFYDLLLTDIRMPHVNRFELCEKILDIRDKY